MDLINAKVSYNVNSFTLENIEIKNQGELKLYIPSSNEVKTQYTNNRVVIDALLVTKHQKYLITHMKIQ
jgi:hypothetical protein